MRKYLLSVILIFTIMLAGCSSNLPRDNSNNLPKENNETKKTTKMAEIYSLALDSMMPIDEGLNGDMKYIAIDTSSLKDATEEDKKYILKYFEKYKVQVMEGSFESLNGQGMVKEGNYIEGVLLKVENIDFSLTNKVKVEGSKFRSGLGAIGVKTQLKNKDGKWIVESADMLWIS